MAALKNELEIRERIAGRLVATMQRERSAGRVGG
jgi:hypothetical protein